MKISELTKLHGFPVKVRKQEWSKVDWVEVIADRRELSYPCFNRSGYAVVIEPLDEDVWELYVEPTKKIKLYAYLRTLHTPFKVGTEDDYCVGIDRSFTLEFFKNEISMPEYIRTPQFDCEVDV